MSKMNIQVIFCLAFAFFISGAHMATITITNKCTQTIWPATLTGNGAQLSTTGFELAQGASRSIDVPSPWTAGRIWARTGCSSASGTFTCATGDCGRGPECQGLSGAKPHTLVEITIDPANNKDTIDVSLVDGFNLPVSITPQGGTGNECVTTSCSANINAACPAVLQVKGSDGSVIACKDACTQFNEPKYCCTGDFCCTPDKCPPTEYSQFFKGQCPQAYSYAKDDQTSTFACTTGGNFAITFCP